MELFDIVKNTKINKLTLPELKEYLESCKYTLIGKKILLVRGEEVLTIECISHYYTNKGKRLSDNPDCQTCFELFRLEGLVTRMDCPTCHLKMLEIYKKNANINIYKKGRKNL